MTRFDFHDYGSGSTEEAASIAREATVEDGAQRLARDEDATSWR